MLTHGTYLLDTCTCISLIKGKAGVVEHIRQVEIDECKVSDITLAELYFGAFKSGKEEHFEDVVEIMNLFEQYSINALKNMGRYVGCLKVKENLLVTWIYLLLLQPLKTISYL